MLKRIGVLFSAISLISMAWLFCSVPEGPDAPSKTSVKVVIENSEGKVFDYPIEESTGAAIRIGAAMYLPENINSVKIKVTENDETVYSETYSDFDKGYYDTAWLDCSFSTEGVKTITVTPESDLNLSAVTSSITITGGSVTPESPKWLFDTIPHTMNTNSQISLDLSKLVTGTVNDDIIFTLQSGSPDNDDVVVSTYVYAASEDDVGTHNVNITVGSKDDANPDLLVIKLTVEEVGEDETPPHITLISPPDTTVTFENDTYIIALLCSDASGVASVTAAIGERTIAAERSDDGFYQISLVDLSSITVSEIVITAVDSSENSNTSKKTIHIINAAQTYSITYVAPGENVEGDVPVDNQLYATGVSAPIAGNTGNLEKEGYTFVGWNTAEDGGGDSYTGGESFTMGTEDVVLYAQWTDESTYSVSYDGNGNTDGDVPEDANNYTEGATVTVKSNSGSLVKTGFSFIGWNVKDDGSGKSYTPGATLTMSTTDVTLYAQWSSNPTYTVTYDGNENTGGEVPEDNTEYEKDMTVTVKDNTGDLVKTGSTFTGWNTEADGSGDYYTADATIVMGTANLVLYAQWSTNLTYTVTYDGNGNTSGAVPTDGTNYEEDMTVTVKENSGNLMKTGSTFTGWNTKEDGSGTSYTAGATLAMGTKNLILYAQWSTNPTFTVTYDGNGNSAGTVPVDGTNYEENITVTVKGNTGNLVKAGFTFSGWNTAANGSGDDYAPSATLEMGTENVTLYAQWTLIPTYTVTYNGNNNTSGTVPSDAIDYEEGMTVTVKANTGDLTRGGYTFTGWNTAADGTGTDRAPEATFEMGSANITLYAKWSQNPTYTVTYDGNDNTGGSVPEDDVHYEVHMMVTVKGNTGNLTRKGFTMTGWNTEADGSGTDRAFNSSFEMGTDNVVLYAKWSQNPVYNVFYDGNGSTGGFIPTDENNYEQDMEVTVLGPGNLTRNGYSFTGWNTAGDGSGTAYAADETFDMGTDDVTLYAMWGANVNSITFNKNDASATGTMSAQSLAYGSTANITLNGFTKAGWTFEGWATSATGDVEFSDGAEYTMGESGITLYAKWTQNTHTVTFNKNDAQATGTMTAQTIAEGSSAALTSNAFVKSGWVFTGWATSASGAVIYGDGELYSMGTVDVTLYAQWTQNTHTVTFNKNDAQATGAMAQQSIGEGTAAALTLNAFTKTGWTFDGWATTSGGPVTYSDGASYTMGTSNVTLYAKWTQITHTIMFNKNDVQAAGTMSNQTIGEGSTVSLSINTFTKTGWSFAGWAASASGTAIYANGDDYTMGTANVTLYAKWTANPYSIIFNRNDVDASGSMTNQTILSGSSAPLRPNAFSKSGWTFDGWATSPSGAKVYDDQASYTMGTSNVTLYAKWTPNYFRITFNKNNGEAGGVMSSQTIASGSTATLYTNSFWDNCRNFVGWATTPTGSAQYSDGGSYTMGTDDVTLYAKWAVTPISVTLAEGTTAQHCIDDPITCMTNYGGCATYEWYYQAFGGPTLITPSMSEWSGCTTRTLTVNTPSGMNIWCVITDLNGNTVTTGTWQVGSGYCD